MIKPTNEFWTVFKATNGALSCAEAVAIMNLAAQSPEGIFLELGSHRGKSSQAIAFAVSLLKEKGELILVEPEFKDEKWLIGVITIVGDMLPESGFKCSLEYSFDVIPKFDKISFCFVDSGSHQDGLPMQEVKLLEDRMVQGGIIAFHDWNSQFKEVKEASDYLVSTGKYEYIPINWDEIIAYVDENNIEEGNVSWHHTELKNPIFVGAVKRI